MMKTITTATNATSIEQQLIMEGWEEGFEEGHDMGKKEKLVRRFFTVFFSILIGLCLGYWWAYSVYLSDNTRAEKDLNKLEQEFHSAIEKPRSFHIFNSQFRVWPVDTIKKRFHYKKVAEHSGG